MNTCPQCHTHLATVEGVCPTCAARSITAFITRRGDPASPIIAGYEVGDVIGQGGMGVVHRAVRLEDGLAVAIKLMPAHLADREEVAERFQREVEALTTLRHPHILRVLDHGISADGRLFLVAELADTDVGRRLQAGPLPVTDALRWFREAAQAIATAHEKGILHRDIKPANLLLMADGSLRVADFSLAKLLQDQGAPPALLTQTREVFGTPYYIAPEVRRGVGQVDARADIYSLGVLLHELLTGRVPMGGHVPASKLAKVPQDVDRLIARCLKEDVSLRPQSVAALLKALDQALHPHWRVMRWWLAAAGVVATAALLPWPRLSLPPPSPANATQAAPWANSLGMTFVPVPGTRVLFCTHETRRRDFAAFAPPLVQADVADDHPVANVSWLRAHEFCEWLTRHEHEQGTLPAHMSYRLPEDGEWSRAAGLSAESGETPQARHLGQGPQGHAPYAWGREWPPLNAHLLENNAGQERALNVPAFRSRQLLHHTDAWDSTAPVASFQANALGLHDMGGNVAEWTLTSWSPQTNERAIRGASWDDCQPDALRLDARGALDPRQSRPTIGFRLVLEQ